MLPAHRGIEACRGRNPEGLAPWRDDRNGTVIERRRRRLGASALGLAHAKRFAKRARIAAPSIGRHRGERAYHDRSAPAVATRMSGIGAFADVLGVSSVEGGDWRLRLEVARRGLDRTRTTIERRGSRQRRRQRQQLVAIVFASLIDPAHCRTRRGLTRRGRRCRRRSARAPCREGKNADGGQETSLRAGPEAEPPPVRIKPIQRRQIGPGMARVAPRRQSGTRRPAGPRPRLSRVNRSIAMIASP